MKKYAVVDIGTNSIRLMIADVDNNKIISKYKTLDTIRVGEGMTTHRKISDAAKMRTLFALKKYLEFSKGYEAFYCFATSAVREAENSKEYVEYIREHCGVRIEIISGEDEASLGFAGSVNGYGGMFDIGGGSTEVMTGTLNNVQYRNSFSIGTVRMLQMFPEAADTDDAAYEKAHALAADTLSYVPLAEDFVYTGIGGTATALAAIDLALVPYDASLVQNHIISLSRAVNLCEMLKSKTENQRKKIVGLQEDRADVIVLGAILMLEFMKASKSKYIVVSDSDNQEGYLIQKLRLL